MLRTIKELLLEWWAGNSTTQMPLPTRYTYDVEVDGKMIQIESFSCSRIYVHYQVRKSILMPSTSALKDKSGNTS